MDFVLLTRRFSLTRVVRSRLAQVVSIATMIAGVSTPAGAEVLNLITWNDPPADAEMYYVNKSTGAAYTARPTLVEHPVGFAQSPTDRLILYTINASIGPSSDLSTLRRNEDGSVTTTVIGALGYDILEGDMAFDSGGQLYALTVPGAGTSPSQLLSINTSTGAASNPVDITGSPNSPTGFSNHSDFSAMAFDGNDDLWVIDNDFSPPDHPTYLLKVNKTTGVVISSFVVSSRLRSPLGMAFSSTGQLYVAGRTLSGTEPRLYKLSLTGTLTAVGDLDLPAGYEASGLTFTPSYVPSASPPTIALLGLLLAGGAVWGIRTQRQGRKALRLS